MSIDLFRVRFQETWGEQYGDYIDDVVTYRELDETLGACALKWFPNSHSLTQDQDSPNVWVAEEAEGEKRRLLFFVEPVG